MNNKIDTPGVYRGTIAETAVKISTNGYPQFVARYNAEQKWVESADEMAHFGLTEPGWVDWTSFSESLMGFQMLYKANVNAGEACIVEGEGKNTTLNHEQLMIAVGWDGVSFDALQDESLAGKQVLFRVEQNDYVTKDGKEVSNLQINWIDAYDAPPQRELKKLGADTLKSLQALVRGPAKKTTPAKPASKAAPVGRPAPAATTPAAKPAPAAKGPPKTTPVAPTKPAAPEKTLEEQLEADNALPAETNQMDAWNAVLAAKGDAPNADVETAWMQAGAEVGGGRDDSTFTAAEWAKVRDIVISKFQTA